MRSEVQLTSRNAASLPQATTGQIFDVQGGRVQILELAGEVTTAFQTQTNNMKLIMDPDSGGSNVDLCAQLDVTGKAVGTQLRVNGDLSDALEAAADVQELLGDYKPIVAGPGNILLSCSASSTGAAKWSILWRALDPGARVVAV